MRVSRAALIVIGVGILLAGVAAIGVGATDALAWRALVVRAKLLGQLPEIPLLDFLRWLRPQSPVYLGGLAHNPNVVSGVGNVLSDSESIEKGARLYGQHCATCHGEGARGKAGPDLVAFTGRNTDWIFFSTVKWGRPGTAMAAQALDDREIWDTHAYLKHAAARFVRTAPPREISIDAANIRESSARPDEWLTYAGNYAGHRHTSLSAISKRNVRQLRVAWIAQLRTGDLFLEASPIVAGDLLFVTESPDGVVALDASTGAKIWSFRRPLPRDLSLCCGSPNRGAAILNDQLFVVTSDAHLVALNASTGRKTWDVEVADYHAGYSMTGAPLALDDRVVVGVAGGEFGIRGFVAAYAAADGRLLWKFDTIPAPGQPGHETWAGDSWKTGGAPTWITGTYDARLHLLYWGVGNPAPDFQDSSRAGDNLYSNSVVALDPITGALKWHFQFTPGDAHDWDAAQQPLLADIRWRGQSRAAMLWANRNGFFYALDRRSGEFFFAKPFAEQTWAKGFSAEGRPIAAPEARPTAKGSLVSPAAGGATNWWPPSYDPARKLVYVPTVDAASIYFARNARVKKSEEPMMGSSDVFSGGESAAASVKAVEAETGKVRWASLLERGPDIVHGVGGVLSTAGGLVFAGYRDEFFALDSDTGRILWRMRVGGRINAPPAAYAIGGTQFIAAIAGNSLFAFSLPRD